MSTYPAEPYPAIASLKDEGIRVNTTCGSDMSSPLQILVLEDDSAFEQVLSGNLRATGLSCELRRVETQEEFVSQLDAGDVSLILADYSLPGFDGMSALQIAKQHSPDIPFIFVSGTMGEERAIESLQQGATDYILKQRLARLGPAVRRALQEAEQRRDKRKLEAQLIQAQKMESIGQLAGGLAHDFNNVLGIIRGYTQVLAAGPDKRPTDDDAAQKVLHCVDRATRLTRQLLTFSRGQEMEQQDIDLNEVIESMARMTERLLGKNITIHCAPMETGPALVRADAGMIEQVLLNLAINARDAMPFGGRIWVSTEEVSIDSDYVETYPQATTGPTVCLRFRDSGTGIPAELLPRIFEPFFTTKDSGKGTGLGLASVYGIVKQHRGWIHVDSAMGKGTEFQIYIPAAEASGIGIETRESLEMPAGNETILVVEDDDSMRELVCNILELCGYTVLNAADGAAALNLWKDSADRIEVMLTDVILADGISGWQLAKRLRAEHPKLKVVYTSGYPIQEVRKDTEPLSEGLNFLQKPFQAQKLAQAVRACLDN